MHPEVIHQTHETFVMHSFRHDDSSFALSEAAIEAFQLLTNTQGYVPSASILHDLLYA